MTRMTRMASPTSAAAGAVRMRWRLRGVAEVPTSRALLMPPAGGIGLGNEVGSCCGNLGAKQVGHETVAGKVLVKESGEGGNLGLLQRFNSAVQYVPGEAKSEAEILRDLQISLGLLEVESEESSEEGEGDDEERFAEFLAYLIAAGRFDAAKAPEAVRRFVEARDKGQRMLEERERQLLEGAS